MICVTIDLVSARGRSRNRRLGQVLIGNDGSGTAKRGNYNAVFRGAKDQLLQRTGRIENWPRQSKPVFSLLRKILESAGY